MNPNTGEIASIQTLDTLNEVFPIEQQQTLVQAFDQAFPVRVSDEQMSEAYLSIHNGNRRAARRNRERDLAKGRVPNAIRRHLLDSRE